MIVGLDVAKLSMVACIHTAKGEVKKPFANSPRGVDDLLRWSKARLPEGDTPSIYLEPTGTYHTLAAHILHDLGANIFAIPPQKSHQALKLLGVTKSDDKDASSIARAATFLQVPQWTPPSDPMLELRELTKRVEALMEQIKREGLRLRELPRRVSWLAVASSIRRSLAFHESERKELQKAIEAFYQVRAHATLQADRNLVRTIPGVGPQAADHLLVLLRTRPLNSAREAAALAGVIPVHKQSGTSVCGRPKMSGQGDRRVRSGLYMPVLSACTHDPGFKTRYQALIASGKPKKSALIACMHRLVRVAYGVLRHQQPYDADHSRGGPQAA